MTTILLEIFKSAITFIEIKVNYYYNFAIHRKITIKTLCYEIF
jgi:hypothetical protein